MVSIGGSFRAGRPGLTFDAFRTAGARDEVTNERQRLCAEAVAKRAIQKGRSFSEGKVRVSEKGRAPLTSFLAEATVLASKVSAGRRRGRGSTLTLTRTRTRTDVTVADGTFALGTGFRRCDGLDVANRAVRQLSPV